MDLIRAKLCSLYKITRLNTALLVFPVTWNNLENSGEDLISQTVSSIRVIKSIGSTERST